MGAKESAQEITEAQVFDLPHKGFKLADHPWGDQLLTQKILVKQNSSYNTYICCGKFIMQTTIYALVSVPSGKDFTNIYREYESCRTLSTSSPRRPVRRRERGRQRRRTST